MTKQILGQLYYQSAIILIFHVFGLQILGFHHIDDSSLKEHHSDIVRTFVFNVFVFTQIFNSFNCRRLDQKLNVFEGMWRNWYFIAIITIEVAIQVLICSIGGSAFGVTHMHAREWVISVALSSVSLPLHALIRLIPDESCERCFKWLQLVPPEPELLDQFDVESSLS
ncbi:cation-transporting P-type ATPase [Lactarius sanguifluus]|nr:cation-transporting P-type ATPase [Lactarius sanguifluus]